jgi:Flp pilus assembly protein TadD
MLETSPDDPFLLYALAMEFKRSNESQALELLGRVIQIDPNQAYAYFQLGQVHEGAGRMDDARDVYRRGIEAAGRGGDEHARSELMGALDALESQGI